MIHHYMQDSRSRCQQRLKIPLNVCLDELLDHWTLLWQNLVQWRHHEPKPCAKSVQYFQGQSNSETNIIKMSSSFFLSLFLNFFFYHIYSTAGPFAVKLGLMVQHHKPECLVKRMDCCVSFQCSLSYCVYAAPMCSCMHQHLCTP